MRIQRVILAWSKVDLEGWRQGDAVVPLTAEAHVATFQMSAAVLDPKDYLDEPAGVVDSATQLLNTLHEILKSSPFPWLEAYANIIFRIKAFQLIAWLRLIRSLQTKFHPLMLEICPPQRISDGSYVYRLAQGSFELVRDILQDEGIRFTAHNPRTPWKTRLLRKSFLGRTVARVALNAFRLNLFPLRGGKHRFVRAAPMQQQADVVLVSQQYTDAFHAAPLARRLAKTFGDRFLWVGMRPEAKIGMTSEEVDLLGNLDIKELHFVYFSSLNDESQASNRKSMLLDLGSAWKVAGVLLHQSRLRVSRDRWSEFLMDPDLRGFAARYRVWAQFLDEVRPKVVVGLSTLQDMALVRAWARRNRVPFVEFMHG